MVGRVVTLDARIHAVVGAFELDMQLAVAAGELVAVLGPNGAGKTSLLRALAGLLSLSAGRVTLDGVVLGAEGNRKPASLSGGQAQRVALARVLALNPALLLLDEPMAALDASTRVEFRRDLRRHLESFRGVRLLVTHDPVEAMAMADRLVVIEHGRVLQSGTPGDVTQHPRSRYVADLVGVNLFRGRASQNVITLADGGSLTAAGAADGDVFAVVHPRTVALYRTRPDGTPRNVWEGRAVDLDLEGDRVRVRLSGLPPIVAEVTPAAVRELGLDRGDQVWVAVKATEVSVYPA